MTESNSKVCSGCAKEFPLTAFTKNKSKRDGLNGECPDCRRASKVRYYAANKDKVKADGAKRYAENKESITAKVNAYRAKNMPKLKEAMKRYSAENQDSVRAWNAEWRASKSEEQKKRDREARRAWEKANPEMKKATVMARRARKNNSPGKLSRGLEKKLYALQNGRCMCCNEPLGDDYHMDHFMPIALGGPHEDWNMQLLRAECNLRKAAKHPIEYFRSLGY